MITKDDLDIRYHPIPGDEGCRIFIGLIPVCEVYHRVQEQDLFKPQIIQWEFIVPNFKKEQSEGQWLEQVHHDLRKYMANSVSEGIEWLLAMLNVK